MAITQETRRLVSDQIQEALLRQTQDRYQMKRELTAKINAIFDGKLLPQELEKLGNSLEVLLMLGGTKDGTQKRTSMEQLDAAFAVLDDPELISWLNTKPKSMWEQLIISKITGQMLDLENIPTPTYARK